MSGDKETTLAIIGGRGALGGGLAKRWLGAGYRVLIGSRDPEAARASAAEIERTVTESGSFFCAVEGTDNVDAARRADVIVVAVPFAHQSQVLESIKSVVKGKVVVDVTVPLRPPKVARVQLPPEGSAGQIAQELLGEDVRVVSALQNVAASYLQAEGPVPCDVLVCGNDQAGRQLVIDLLADIEINGLHAGTIANSAAAEALTSVLIALNKRYNTHTGIRITGID